MQVSQLKPRERLSTRVIYHKPTLQTSQTATKPGVRLTIHVESRLVGDSASPVRRCAGVGAAVFRPHAGDVHVADHRTAHAHVLPHNQPAGEGR